MSSPSHDSVKHKTQDEEKSLLMLLIRASSSILFRSERTLERNIPDDFSLFQTGRHSTMMQTLCVAILFVSCVADNVVLDSFSKPIGGEGGVSFASNMTGPITGVKVWVYSDRWHCIGGIQFRYDTEWSDVMGHTYGMVQEIDLFDGEFIVQLSGRYQYSEIRLLIFVTSRGRSLIAGPANGDAFNFYPVHPDSELQMLSGRFNGLCITSLAAHWGLPYDDNNK